jgi:D-alanine-D-alanine ligase
MEILQRFGQPALVEAFLPGREFTVGIRGTGKESAVIAVMEVMFTGHAHDGTYSYETKKNYEERVSYRLVNDSVAEKAGEVALVAWRGLGCRDAGRIDLRADVHGVPNFIEVNPLPVYTPLIRTCPFSAGWQGSVTVN